MKHIVVGYKIYKDSVLLFLVSDDDVKTLADDGDSCCSVFVPKSRVPDVFSLLGCSVTCKLYKDKNGKWREYIIFNERSK